MPITAMAEDFDNTTIYYIFIKNVVKEIKLITSYNVHFHVHTRTISIYIIYIHET
jgi:hypothetical protein